MQNIIELFPTQIYKKKLLQDALESEVYKKIKENFPDAELSEVEEVK